MRALSLSVVALFALTLRPNPADPQPPAAQPAPKTAADDGVLPLGADGKPLNLDFETGTLQHWRAEGEAFAGQPIKGDTVNRRRSDMKSQHAGNYWVGTYEVKGDAPQGTLTSAPFKVTHPYASFLVGGGAHPTTCVELVRRDTQKVFFRASGQDTENMRRVVVDLRPHKDREIFIRVVDKHSGHWGHVNFDDFKFHRAKPSFPQTPDGQAPADVYPYAGLKPEEAAKVMKLPEGFSVTLCAAEPDVRQPIAMALDDRGRLWVAEAYSYPVRRKDQDAKDRILIFEDTTGTGKFDRRTVFYEGLNLVSGLEVGFGGVWVGAAPYLLFIPDRDGDGKPDGPPEVVLDGWGYQDTHETLNTFIWGPDGWLYGCHGVFTHSRVGKPGTPDRERVPINAGIWRYHPLKKQFEVFAHGTSNPWGVDFNDQGQVFCTACVVPHLFHVIQGARYHRQAGAHFNPHTYDDIKTVADHLHWGGANPWAGNNRSDSYGGGHAHCGAMIYLGGAWPEKYRGAIFMNNIHGQRVNMDLLRPKGSGYVGLHGPDFLLTQDRWSQMLNLRYGPDGQVYVIDWYDRQACHTVNINDHDRSNGRIFKISYKQPKHVRVDLQKRTSAELVELQLHANDWYVRHARRILQERGPDPAVHRTLAKFAFDHHDETRRLRGLWALHVTGGLTEELLAKALANDRPAVRGWAVQLAMEDARPSAATLKTFAEMARTDTSPEVRLYLAAALQRLAPERRWDILEGLLAHGEDAADHNLPLMYWYAAEPLGGLDPGKALELTGRGKLPLLVGYMARRVASLDTPAALDAVVRALGRRADSARRLALLRGLGEALKGRRQAAMPVSWPAAFAKLAADANPEVRSRAQGLAVTFGDPQAFAAMRKLLVDRATDLGARQAALASLLGARDRELAPTLQALLKEKETALRRAALRGLAAYDHPETAKVILDAYAGFTLEEKRDALNTLAARPATAKALLAALGQKRVPAADVSADIIRQLRNLRSDEIDKQITQVWGTVRETAQDKAKEVTRYKRLLTDASLPPPDPSLGRLIFVKTCQQCHTLFGAGGKVGPDITGSNRADLDYLLSNILDPSAVMAKEYQTTVVTTTDGRILSGIVRRQDKRAIVLVTATETLTLPRDEIDRMRPDNKSMMPDDLLKRLSDAEVRALAAYLRGPAQVPLPATADNVKDFFTGRDLAGWDGDPAVWSVHKGEIVGKGASLKRDAFLRSQLLVGDFRLTFAVKVVPAGGSAGVLFRAEGLPDGGVRGYRAGLGNDWLELRELQGRGLLASIKTGDPLPDARGWSRYEIVAKGDRVRTFLNGAPWFDLTDPDGARRGIIAFQLPAGTGEVRLKELRLELGK
jgi:putative membrane-bound dehydrogenase-like protein